IKEGWPATTRKSSSGPTRTIGILGRARTVLLLVGRLRRRLRIGPVRLAVQGHRHRLGALGHGMAKGPVRPFDLLIVHGSGILHGHGSLLSRTTRPARRI